MKTKKHSNDKKSIRKKKKKTKVIGIHGLSDSKGSKYVDAGDKDPYKNKGLYDFFSRIKILGKNYKKNFLFWITYCICITILSIKYGNQSSIFKNIFMGFISVLLVMSTGYMAHYLSHSICFRKLYEDKFESKNLSTENNEKIKCIIDYTLDFHDKIHHNTNSNIELSNILIEAIQNMLLEGVLLIILSVIVGLGIQINGEIYKLNIATMFLWVILYATVHLINYRIVHPNSHISHHMDYYKNLSLTDMFDLIFNTKYDKRKIQDLHHFIINTVLITIILYFSKDICEVFTNF